MAKHFAEKEEAARLRAECQRLGVDSGPDWIEGERRWRQAKYGRAAKAYRKCLERADDQGGNPAPRDEASIDVADAASSAGDSEIANESTPCMNTEDSDVGNEPTSIVIPESTEAASAAAGTTEDIITRLDALQPDAGQDGLDFVAALEVSAKTHQTQATLYRIRIGRWVAEQTPAWGQIGTFKKQVADRLGISTRRLHTYVQAWESLSATTIVDNLEVDLQKS